jgi:hypothetical protein
MEKVLMLFTPLKSKQLFEITHIDDIGRNLLSGLTIGDKMILEQQDRNQVKLIVRGLAISNHVACQASVEKE